MLSVWGYNAPDMIKCRDLKTGSIRDKTLVVVGSCASEGDEIGDSSGSKMVSSLYRFVQFLLCDDKGAVD